jgi:uncharacterized protein YbjT (DUF2867 family)
MNRIFVIGGTGTVGRHVLSRLATTGAEIKGAPPRTFPDWAIDNAAEFRAGSRIPKA